MSKHKTTNLVHEAFTSLLARAAKYNDPQNLEWDWERTDRMERHAINAVLDLQAERETNAELLAALQAVEKRGCSCHSNKQDNWHSGRCLIPMIRAAIRKARGEA